jgi:hypothetical protein
LNERYDNASTLVAMTHALSKFRKKKKKKKSVDSLPFPS